MRTFSEQGGSGWQEEGSGFLLPDTCPITPIPCFNIPMVCNAFGQRWYQTENNQVEIIHLARSAKTRFV